MEMAEGEKMWVVALMEAERALGLGEKLQELVVARM